MTKRLCYTGFMKCWLVFGRLAQSKRGSVPGAGYTVVETMTVLAVTTVLFFTISLAFRGRQASAEFTQAVRSYEAKLQSIMTEISNGYYETKSECRTPGPGSPIVDPAMPATAGTNEDCIFMGKVVVSDELKSKIVTLAGRRIVTSGGVTRDVRDIGEATPVLVADGPLSDPYNVSFTHSYQLKVTRVIRLDGVAPVDVAAFAFVNPLSAAVSSNRLTQLYAYPGTTLNQDPATLTGLTPMTAGIKICLQAQNNQRAEVTIGSLRSQTTISSVLDTQPGGGCP